MYDYYKLHSAACSNACRPVVIHAVIMSIIFEHYKQLSTTKNSMTQILHIYSINERFGFLSDLGHEKRPNYCFYYHEYQI